MKHSQFRFADGSLKLIRGGDFTTIEEIGKAFEDFKKLNDKRIEEVEKYGTASAAATAAADKANAAIVELQTKFDALPSRIEDLENRLNREHMGGGNGSKLSDQQLIRYANWQTAIEVGAKKRSIDDPIDPANIDLDFINGYKRGFANYLRTGQVSNEMSVGSDPDGGYAVDPDMNGRTVEFIYESSPIRQLASVQVIQGDKLEGETDLGEAGDGWVGETEPRAETTTPQIAEWSIPLREQYSQPYTTQRILDFANFDVGAWLEGKVRRKLARSEATGFVSGATTKRPRGFMTYPAGTPGATVATWPQIRQVPSGEVYSAGVAGLTSDGIIDLVYAIKTDYLPGAVIGGNRTTEAEIRKLKDGNGAYIWQPNFTERNQARVAGLPWVDLPDMPNIGTDTLPIVGANFAEAYQIVDSPIGIRVLRDNVTTKGKVKFYTTRYVGGDVLNFEAIVIQKIAAS